MGWALLLIATPALGQTLEQLRMMDPADPQTRQAFNSRLDALLIGAGERADVVRAKQVADLARKRGVKLDTFDEFAKEILATVDRCYAAGPARIPARDEPTPKVRERWTGELSCDRLRPGLRETDTAGSPYAACLLSVKPRDRRRLAEAYANGWGVKRDLRLAMALVCRAGDDLAPAEMWAMTGALDARRRGLPQDEPFTFCAHVTSARNAQECLMESEQDGTDRDDLRLERLSAGWKPDEKDALEHMVGAGRALAENISKRHEAGPEFTPHYMELPFYAFRRQMRALFEDLAFVEVNPPPEETDLEDAGRELDEVWVELGSGDAPADEELRHLWEGYREAWAALGTARHPGSSPAAWKTWITRRRIELVKQGDP